VQHIAQGFLPGLVRWFAGICPLRIQVAKTGEVPHGGGVYLAPDGCDLELDGQGRLRTPHGASLHTPSGNRLLHSLAKVLGARAAGFVLTGMGDDGAQGLLALRNAGGATFAQDEQSSVVFGMPQAAEACGATRSLLAVEQIAPAILELCRLTRDATWK
jgi:two-component system chemotaxis response regulator CheB